MCWIITNHNKLIFCCKNLPSPYFLVRPNFVLNLIWFDLIFFFFFFFCHSQNLCNASKSKYFFFLKSILTTPLKICHPAFVKPSQKAPSGPSIHVATCMHRHCMVIQWNVIPDAPSMSLAGFKEGRFAHLIWDELLYTLLKTSKILTQSSSAIVTSAGYVFLLGVQNDDNYNLNK